MLLDGFLLSLIEAASQVRSGGAAFRFASFLDGQFRLNRLASLSTHSQRNGIRNNMALAKRIIPCLDVTAGRVVKGVNFLELRNAGDDKISMNSSAVANPQLVRDASDKHGSQCIVVAIDAKRVSAAGETPRWEVFTHGGRKNTGLDVIEWARKMAEFGAGEILLTSMDRDGTKSGFDLALTRAVSDAISI